MGRVKVLAGIALLLAGVLLPVGRPAASAATTTATQVLATGFNYPWEVVVRPDGSYLIT